MCKMVDDICLYANTKEEIIENFITLMEKCHEHNITLSKGKVKIISKIGDRQEFLEQLIELTKAGVLIRPDPGRLAALKRFPTPKTPTDVKSFMGLGVQLGAFHCDIQHMTDKMRALTRKNVAWNWTPEIDREFKTARMILSSAACVRPYDVDLESELVVDASRVGWDMPYYKDQQEDGRNVMNAKRNQEQKAYPQQKH